MRARSIQLLLLPVILALGTSALAAWLLPSLFGRAGERVELRELYVREVVNAEFFGTELVVLQAVGDPVLVPVFVAPHEGAAIRAARVGEGGATGHVEQTLVGLGAEIRAVLLDHTDGRLAGLLIVEQGGDQLPIELTAGAAIATALTTGQPLLITPDAFEQDGLGADELRDLLEPAVPDQNRQPTWSL